MLNLYNTDGIVTEQLTAKMSTLKIGCIIGFGQSIINCDSSLYDIGVPCDMVL